MTKKHFVIKRAELEPGQVCKVAAAGDCPLAIFNVNGRFYATSDACTHGDASLSTGEIVDGDIIECPVHQGQFHIPTGQAVAFPCEVDIRTYRIIEDGDDIYVDLDAESEEAVSSI